MLTDAVIRQAKPRTARFELKDTVRPGLRLVVQPSGHKSFVYRYTTRGRPASILEARRPGAMGGAPMSDLAGIGPKTLFAEHDVWIVANVEYVALHANGKAREVISKKFAAALWIDGPPHASYPPDWKITKVDDDPDKVKRIIDWCVNNGCAVAVDLPNGTTATIPPQKMY
jgi:Arm DNA-binding domain